MRSSKFANSITPSLTRKLFNMANEIGGDVINLTLGDPDLLPPKEIREFACDAIMKGKTRYSANAGLIELREKYADFFEKEYNSVIDPNKNIIATVGGMEALFLSLASIVNSEDEVIILAPYYVNYFQMVNMLGGKAVVVDIYNKENEEILRDISNAITSKTIAMIINTPCNPTGEVLSSDLVDKLAQVAILNDLLVISDEVYRSLVFDGKKAESVFTRPEMSKRTIVIDSCSKRFAMTGWRIGFAIAPEEIIANMTKMQENVAACAPLASQYGAIKAYSGDVDYSYIKQTFEKRRDIVCNAISSIPQLKCKKSQATFYCFVDISKTGKNSEQFAYELLKEQHVAVVPGVTYGENYSNYVRIAFTLNEDILMNAMERIKKYCDGLKV